MSTTQNETQGITQTVRSALNNAGYGSYISYAGPVIEALTARETDLSEKLIDYAVDAGGSADEVRHYLREIGMAVTVIEEDEPEVEPEVTSKKKGKQSKRELLERLSAQVDSLTDFARRNGYRSN